MKVFVSSVYKGLEEIRRRLIDAITTAGDSPVSMEAFGARPEQALQVCLSEVRQADVLVLILGPRYGSVDPASGLSYTNLEFHEALGASIPVLAFEVPSDELAREPADEHADKLAAFKKEVRSNCTTHPLANSVTLPEQAMAAIKRFASDWTAKIGQFRTFQTAQDFFASMLDTSAAFSHTYSLVGRDAVVQELVDFLRGDKFCVVLPGPGGVGKSRLLLQLDARCQGEAMRLAFLGPQFELRPEVLRELPNTPVCVVVDDAHRLMSLDALVQTMAGLKRPQSLKLLLTCRPSGLDRVRYALRAISDDSLSVLPELQPLSIATDGEALAKASLGTTLEHLARRLAEVADGNPLIITVGGRLIQRGHVRPELLAHKEDFRITALDGLLADLPDEMDGHVPSRRLLADLAAIGPVRPGKEPVEELLAKHLGASQSAVCSALETLRDKHHVLLRRGYKVRVQPDVLADHLLYRAAIAGQRATGFVNEVMTHFGSIYLSSILTNASELEWRCRSTGASVDVLGEVWREMRGSLPQLSHRARIELLTRLEGAAWFAPDQVWEVVQWAIQNERAPDEDTQLARAFPTGQADVLRQVPRLLRILAWHQLWAARVARLLWCLGERDNRPLNSALDSPLRILQDALAYDPQKPLSLQDELLTGLEEAVHGENKQGRYRDVTQIVSSLLSREPRVIRSDCAQISVGSIALSPSSPKIQHIRSRAIKMLAEQAHWPRPAFAVKAISTLGALFHPPHGFFGREVTDAEIAAWEPEVNDGIRVLAIIARDVAESVVSYYARRAIVESRITHSWPSTKTLLEAAVAGIAERPEFWLYDLLRPAYEAPDWHEDWQAAEAEYPKKMQAGAREIWGRFGNAREVIRQISNALEHMSAAELPHHGFIVLKHLCDERPDQVPNLMQAILDCACGALKRESSQVMAAWLETEASVALAELNRIIARDDEDEVAAVASGYFSRWFGHPEEHSQEHLSNIKRLLGSRHLNIRRNVVHSLRWSKGMCEREALGVLLSTDLGQDEKLLDEAFGVIDKRYGVDPDLLTNEDMAALLKKVESIPRLDQHLYHVDSFLGLASEKAPAAVVEMLLKRVRKAASLPDGSSRDFQPLPYLEFHKGLTGLKDSPDYTDLLRRIRDESLGKHWVYSFWMPKLYSLASSGYCGTSIEVLREWVRSNDCQRIVAASHLLHEAGHAFVYDHDEFVSECLNAAEKAGTECLQRVRSSLFSVAVSGTVSSAFGEAPPRYVEDKKRAIAMAARHQDVPVVATFFSDLARHCDNEIQEHRARDEELLDE